MRKRIINYRFFGMQYQPETIAYVQRVTADGGQVIDIQYVDQVFKTLKALGLLSNLVNMTDYRAGIKRDASNHVSKVYSLDLNSKDSIQGTGYRQPVYTNEGIVFDGTDDTLVSTVPLDTFANGMTFETRIIAAEQTSWGMPIAIFDRTYLSNSFGNNKSRVSILTTTAQRVAEIASPVFNEQIDLAATYNQSVLKGFLNSVEGGSNILNEPLKTTTNDRMWLGSMGFVYYFKGTIKQTRVFNIALTTEQIQKLNTL